MGYQATNNARSYLASGINASATSITVATGQGDRFPVINQGGSGTDYTYVTLEDSSGNREIIKIVRRDSGSDVLTIGVTGSAASVSGRAQDGTSARSWLANDVVGLRLTAELLETAIAHAGLSTGAHSAAAIVVTPSGGIAATDLAAALQELDTEKANVASPTFTGTPAAPTAAYGTNSTQLATTEFVQSAIAGKQTAWIPAGAFLPRLTSGAAPGVVETTTNKIVFKSLDFDQSTIEYAQVQVRMPKSWNEGTVTATCTWSSTASSGNCVWALRGVAISDDDLLDAAMGTAQAVTDGVTGTGDFMQSAETSAVTVAGTPADGDLVVFELYRDASNVSDTLTADARFHGMTLFYTTSAPNDA